MRTFDKLSEINVNEHTEKKGQLTYLSWAWAWSIFSQNVDKPTYKVYENNNINYFTDGKTAWVKVGVSDGETEHIEMLPIMDFKNKSIHINNITSVEVNKTIQRALTKAIARHGLGLYIYAGEDLPDKEDGKNTVNTQYNTPSKASDEEKEQAWKEFATICRVNEADPNEFIKWLGIPQDKIYAQVRKWLHDEQQLVDQINSYLDRPAYA